MTTSPAPVAPEGLTPQFRCDGLYRASCEKCHGDPIECDSYYNPRMAFTKSPAAPAAPSSAEPPKQAQSEPVAWQWRKRITWFEGTSEATSFWTEWEPLVPPCMDARDLAKTDPENYELHPLYAAPQPASPPPDRAGLASEAHRLVELYAQAAHDQGPLVKPCREAHEAIDALASLPPVAPTDEYHVIGWEYRLPNSGGWRNCSPDTYLTKQAQGKDVRQVYVKDEDHYE